ncbi:aspartate 1-decarboxylase autocleavage activator PanM [Hafnia alvei]|uniref:PanD regulatory factor n=1 Tax=Hafnia alvei TaxID=569 RepID=A0A1C6Z2Q7_HAFAL|nr:aspartate 1-decarboxylase autocleavage activator PanM [Hafnia alvei]NLS54673.1 aspartate 1-decarboxylase autocleavage activator PanM [Hafnia alvei]SCM53490.1 Acetyltransferase (GNAT) domain-containing protein [Hafnia alvei]
MKLTIERLVELNSDDIRDLGKVWPEQQPEAWQAWLEAGNALFAARFNDRLLGAVKVFLDKPKGFATLHDLCVREVTRRRGVGLYLMEDTLRQLPDINVWQLAVSEVPSENRAEMDAFMKACGFNFCELSNGEQGWQS